MKVAVVGAGIMGRLIAFELVNSGYQVSLFDRDDEHGTLSCSHAAAGLLAPITELEKSNRLISILGHDALRIYWPNILSQLNENIYFQTLGTVVVSHPRDKSDLIRFIEIINTKSNCPSKRLSVDDLKILEPELTKFSDAYYFQDEGQIDSQNIFNCLGNYLNQTTTWFKKTRVDEIFPGKLMQNGLEKSFDLVIDCRGMGGKAMFNHLQAIRGELIWLHAPEVNIKRPIRFLHPRYSLYIVPRANNVYLVGASEVPVEDHKQITVRTTLELLTAVYYLHPGFAEAEIIKTVTQCRPTLPDYLPKIKYQNGLIAINGLYRHGFLLAPTLANEVKRWIEYGDDAITYPQLWEKMNDQSQIQYRNYYAGEAIITG